MVAAVDRSEAEAVEGAEPLDLAARFGWPAIEKQAPPHLLQEYRDVCALVDQGAARLLKLLETPGGWTEEQLGEFNALQKLWASGESRKVDLGDRLAKLAKPGAGGIAG